MRSVFARVGAWCVERPGPVIALAVLLVILGTVGALSLEPNGEADTLVDESSETFKATEELKDKFGDDPIVVLIKGDLEQFVLTEDLQRILFLESCLAGTAPEGEVAKGIETPEVCNEAGRVEARARRLRPGHLPQPVRQPGDSAVSGPTASGAGAGPGGRQGGLQGSDRERPR